MSTVLLFVTFFSSTQLSPLPNSTNTGAGALHIKIDPNSNVREVKMSGGENAKEVKCQGGQWQL